MRNNTKNLAVILILLFIVSIEGSPKFNYGLSLSYKFDSNIGQNINETSAHYVVPALNFKLKGLGLKPWYIRTNFVYDAYQKKRVPTLNSPFVNVGTGFDFKSGRFSYTPELAVLLYLGMNVHVKGDPEGSIKNLVPVKRSLRLKNGIKFNYNRSRLSLDNYVRINDLAESAAATSEDELRIEIVPGYRYRFRVLKRDIIKVRNAGVAVEYEGNFSRDTAESYNYLSAIAYVEIKFGRVDFNLKSSLARKSFTAKMKHPQKENEVILPVNKYAILSPSLEIPIISDLSLEVGGKFRFKGSNNPSYDYDRHTFHAKIQWRSSLQRED